MRFNYLAHNILRIKKKIEVFNIFFKSLLINQLPIPILADGFKILKLKNISKKKELSLYIVFIERIAGLISNLTLAFFFVNIYIYYFLYNYLYIVLTIELISLIIFIQFNQFFILKIPYLNYVFLYIKKINKIDKIILITLIFSFCSQLLSLLTIFYILTLFFNAKLIFSILLFFQLSNLIISLPLFINGIGIREVMYGIIFHSVLKVDYSYAILSASLINVVTIINIIMVLIFINKEKFLFFFMKIK